MGLNSIPTYSDRKAVYISESGLFISLGEFSKTPSDGTCLREPPGGVCDVGCCFWPHSRFFISLLFDVTRHPSVDYRQGFYTPFYTFSPAHRRAIRDTFILTFLGFSFLPRVLRFWVSIFYPRAFFTLHSFVCHSGEGRNTPSRILLCACPHRVVPSGWRMDLNYKTIDLSFAPVSHEV